MRILLTGGTGVLGRSTLPLLRAEGHEVAAPGREELDLFDPGAVAAAVAGHDAVLHLATRIPPRERQRDPAAWIENDRLRREATRLLVDAALAGRASVFVQASIAFLSLPGPVPDSFRSALAAEAEAARLAAAGRRGVVLRLGLLDGPGTGNAAPVTTAGATLHVDDAGRALAAALTVPSGVYDVCRDGERVLNSEFVAASVWRPER